MKKIIAIAAVLALTTAATTVSSPAHAGGKARALKGLVRGAAGLVMLGRAGSAAANPAQQSNCWFELDNGEYDGQRCSISSRKNANNHTVWDIKAPGANKVSVVLWDNQKAEYFYEGQRYVGTWDTDKDGFGTRVYSGGTSFIFRN